MQRRIRSRRTSSQTNVESLETRVLPATFTVTSLADTVADDGQLTLREAIQEANDRNGPDTVVIAEQGRIRLRNGVLPVNDDLTIRGLAPLQSSVDGLGATGILEVTDAKLRVEDITLVNGYANLGGAIDMNGSQLLEIDNVRFLNNKSEAFGGAIRAAKLSVSNSFFRGNTSRNSGAIYARTHGTVVDTVFNSNEATGDGGALGGFRDVEGLGFSGTSWEIAGSTFSDNNSPNGSVISDADDATIDDSVFRDNVGDAVIDDMENVTLTNSSIYSNDAIAIRVVYHATVTNSSVLENTKGGVYSGRANIDNSTIHGNGGFGVLMDLGVIRSSIVANNTRADIDVYETTDLTLENSLLGSNGGSDWTETGATSPDSEGNYVGSDQSPLDPGLLPVSDYGTGHWIALPDVGSLAIDAGSNPLSLTTDQVGGRRVAGNVADMGAVEYSDAGVSTANRVLQLEGTAGDDRITMWRSGGDYFINVNNEIARTAAGDFDEVNIRGLGGHDLIDVAGLLVPADISGGSGNDTIQGGDGDDTIGGGRGTDDLRGGAGDDSILGGNGSDTLHGSHDNDDLNGEKGHDLVYGGTGDDTMRGFSGNDTVLGGAGSDVMFGGSGNDSIRGGLGEDSVLGGNGSDIIDGADGHDFLSGGNGRDLITGGDGSDYLFGDSGKDTLHGSAGDDVLVGGRSESLPAFDAIDAIWRSGDSYNARVNQVRELFPGEDWARTNNVQALALDDSSADELNGDAGLDFFYARVDGSPADVFDRDSDERFENL